MSRLIKDFQIFQISIKLGAGTLKDQSPKSQQHAAPMSYTIQGESFKILSVKTVGQHRKQVFFPTLTGRVKRLLHSSPSSSSQWAGMSGMTGISIHSIRKRHW